MQLPAFKRDITKKIYERLRGKREFLQVIAGPRQVGKTTAILQVMNDLNLPYHYASADLPAPPQTSWIPQQWDIARQKLKEVDKVILVLDEVQKVAHWSDQIKGFWDEDTRKNRNIQVVILGSSSLLIQRGLTESLAGRFEIIRFTHWSWKECHDCFNWPLEKYLYFGGYPGASTLVEDENRWAQYIRDSLIETVISKDILLLNRVEKPALLRQLFVLACEYGGQILSYQKLLGQLIEAGNTTTLSHYQGLLESAFLIKGLEKWAGSTVKIRKSSPKWVPLNTALMTALANRTFKEYRNDPELWGRLVEVGVGAYIINEAIKEGFDIYYWREKNYEVDYVVKRGKKLAAIEVKTTRRRMSLVGLSLFKKRYLSAKEIIVGPGGVEIEDFLKLPLVSILE